MSTFEIKMPKLGESITEGTIVSWSVKVGDAVQEDDVLFEVSTAKVSAEIPSPVAGKVLELLFSEGDTVAVGTTVALIQLEGEEIISRPRKVPSPHKVIPKTCVNRRRSPPSPIDVTHHLRSMVSTITNRRSPPSTIDATRHLSPKTKRSKWTALPVSYQTIWSCRKKCLPTLQLLSKPTSPDW